MYRSIPSLRGNKGPFYPGGETLRTQVGMSRYLSSSGSISATPILAIQVSQSLCSKFGIYETTEKTDHEISMPDVTYDPLKNHRIKNGRARFTLTCMKHFEEVTFSPKLSIKYSLAWSG
jgi:hypothetical protein